MDDRNYVRRRYEADARLHAISRALPALLTLALVLLILVTAGG